MMDQILKKRGLMRKIEKPQKIEDNKNINKDFKMNNIKNNNNNSIVSFKDKIHTFEIQVEKNKKILIIIKIREKVHLKQILLMIIMLIKKITKI